MTVWIHCDKCGIRIKKVVHNHKYCKSCAYKVYLEKMLLRQKKHCSKIASALGPHMRYKEDGEPDFKAEHKAIKKEMKRLGLRK